MRLPVEVEGRVALGAMVWGELPVVRGGGDGGVTAEGAAAQVNGGEVLWAGEEDGAGVDDEVEGGGGSGAGVGEEIGGAGGVGEGGGLGPGLGPDWVKVPL